MIASGQLRRARGEEEGVWTVGSGLCVGWSACGEEAALGMWCKKEKNSFFFFLHKSGNSNSLWDPQRQGIGITGRPSWVSCCSVHWEERLGTSYVVLAPEWMLRALSTQASGTALFSLRSVRNPAWSLLASCRWSVWARSIITEDVYRAN